MSRDVLDNSRGRPSARVVLGHRGLEDWTGETVDRKHKPDPSTRVLPPMPGVMLLTRYDST